MKFKKMPNVFMFSKYIREDGQFIIESVDIKVNGHYKNVFEVTNANGEHIEYMNKLKDAKAKYSEL